MQNGKFYFANEKECTAEDLIAFMYKINFLNARKDVAGGFIDRKYFEDNKYITSKNVDFGYDWEVHPAFRWALYPETRDIFDIQIFLKIYNNIYDWIQIYNLHSIIIDKKW